MRKKITYLLAFIFVFSFISLSFAQEKITILISGQSHSSLYPCKCPKAPNGGVARRATVIKKIKKSDKNVLILEAGGSFAGGNYDGNSLTTELDKKRTESYLGSLVKMGYSAFLISSEEFNFGEDFLKKMMSKYRLDYLSANLGGNFLPYTIKKVGKVKVAIIGITDARVKTKTQLEYIEAKVSLANTIKEVKTKKDADVVVVLAYLDSQKSKELIGELEGVDIWVSSNNSYRTANSEKNNGTTLIIPAWEVRSLTKLNLTFNDKEPPSVDVEHIALNKDVEDDRRMSSAVPSCFSDLNCVKPGFVGKCKKAGTKRSKCEYTKLESLKMTVIKPSTCKTCDVNTALERIKKVLPHVETTIISEDSKLAKELIRNLGIRMLPAYVIDGSIKKEASVAQVKKIAKEVGDYYLVESSFSGVSYFADREKISNRLDVFFDIKTEGIVNILGVLQELKTKNKDIDIHLNFLAIEDPKEGILAKGGKYEIEEFLRVACINKYYTDKLWYYLSCRLSDIQSSWWDDCALKLKMDPLKIKGCAQTQEGETLLREFIRLTQELEVVFGPTFVINNQEIFSSKGAPTVEELENLFK